MADSRDILGKNRKFKGTAGVVMPKGTTDQRANTESGELRFNTTIGLMEYYDGSIWKPIDAPPTITSITTNDTTGSSVVVTPGSTYTVTITGGNFSLGPTVKFIGNTGTQYTAASINRVSSSSITCVTLIGMGLADDPYDIEVTNSSGLSATLEDALTYNALPVFVTAAGTLGDVYEGQTVSGSTLNASATDAESNTITYSIVSGSLPGSGLTLSSSTGYITGTLTGAASIAVYSFTVRATTTEGVVDRAFSLNKIAPPFVAATGGTILTCGDYKTHVFLSPGTFTVTTAGTPAGSNSVEYLVVAGGAGGAAGKCNSDGNHGGGGAGGYRTNYPVPSTTGLPVSATGYPISVGGGGNGGYGPNGCVTSAGAAGTPSVFSNITSAGGGGGGSDSIPTGGSGGSGGGGNSGGIGGTGNSPPVSPPQGNNGGPGSTQSGAGGGAGATGGTGGPPTVGGKGGLGAAIATAFFGPTAPSYGTPGPAAGRYFAGGGASGRSSNNTSGGAPDGGGGGGASPNGPGNIGISGISYTGGGGGASGSGLSGNAQGGAGGTGIVVIRYKFQ